MSSPGSQLRRRRLGVIHIVFFTVAASAPLTVLGGAVTTQYAVTGVTGVPCRSSCSRSPSPCSRSATPR